MRKSNLKYFSIACNQKLGKNIAVFNLPTGITCPGKSAYCSIKCYAKKAETKKYPREKRLRNLKATRKKNFTKEITKELARCIKDYGTTMVRIHESGDFFSQKYLNSIFSMIRKFPNTKFLAYTKTYKLDFSRKPKNLMLKQSYDATNLDVPAIPNVPKTYVFTRKEGTPFQMMKLPKVPKSGAFRLCPTKEELAKKGEEVEEVENYCGIRCKLCWNTNHDILFREH